MNFSDKKIKNRPFNVPVCDRIYRSLVLKLAWKSLPALKFSNSLTFPDFWIKCWNSLTFWSNIKFPDFSRILDKMLKFPHFSRILNKMLKFPDFFLIFWPNIKFPGFSSLSRLRSNPEQFTYDIDLFIYKISISYNKPIAYFNQWKCLALKEFLKKLKQNTSSILSYNKANLFKRIKILQE